MNPTNNVQKLLGLKANINIDLQFNLKHQTSNCYRCLWTAKMKLLRIGVEKANTTQGSITIGWHILGYEGKKWGCCVGRGHSTLPFSNLMMDQGITPWMDGNNMAIRNLKILPFLPHIINHTHWWCAQPSFSYIFTHIYTLRHDHRLEEGLAMCGVPRTTHHPPPILPVLKDSRLMRLTCTETQRELGLKSCFKTVPNIFVFTYIHIMVFLMIYCWTIQPWTHRWLNAWWYTHVLLWYMIVVERKFWLFIYIFY